LANLSFLPRGDGSLTIGGEIQPVARAADARIVRILPRQCPTLALDFM
jgi:hypothetical protein